MDSPRVIMYAQTITNESKQPISLLPLIQNPSGITHLVIAMLHLNVTHPQGHKITINNDATEDPIWDTLRAEIPQFKAAGVKVLCCLGGAARGSYRPALEDHWDTFYPLLQQFLIEFGIDGLDIDIEEAVDQSTIERLITALRQDFPADFIVTLTPVARALQPRRFLFRPQPGWARVDYPALEKKFGRSINWYNTQFYYRWGDIQTSRDLDSIVANGFPANLITVIVSTNEVNAPPAYQEPLLSQYLKALKDKHPNLGGVAGWEYFNAKLSTSETHPPWKWLQAIGRAVGGQSDGH